MDRNGDIMIEIKRYDKYLSALIGLILFACILSGCASQSYKSAGPEFIKFCEEYASAKCATPGTVWQAKRRYSSEYEKLQTEASCWLHFYEECIENPDYKEEFKPSPQ